MKVLFILLLVFSLNQINSKTIIVSNQSQINSLTEAAKSAVAGDTILFKSGDYNGGEYISNLKGDINKPIFIIAEFADVTINGGTSAWQLSDVEYLIIEGFEFKGQTGNGVNIDDAGTYDTPSKIIKIQNCIFGNINATGNNDLLKLSGVDSLTIANCIFENGSAGGSMIDMVGCHNVAIEENVFQNAGSNAIQAKGGTKDVVIQRNYFLNCGQRAINIGGSTGLEFFRPLGVKYESNNINVFSNLFVGSVAPIAYVGTVNSKVINNTIIMPEKWVIRILQENTNDGFIQCSDNSFINNIVYLDDRASNPSVNIGGNTLSETFKFSNNLFFNEENPNWSGPNFPSLDKNFIYADPEFSDFNFSDYTLKQNSPAIGKGLGTKYPQLDLNNNKFKSPRSIGAYEYDDIGSINENKQKDYILNYDGINNQISIEFENICSNNQIDLIDIKGNSYLSDLKIIDKINVIDLNNLKISNQSCFLIIKDCNNLHFEKINIVR